MPSILLGLASTPSLSTSPRPQSRSRASFSDLSGGVAVVAAEMQGGCREKAPRGALVVDFSNVADQTRGRLMRSIPGPPPPRVIAALRGALSTGSPPAVLLWGRTATPKQDSPTLEVSPTPEVCATASRESGRRRCKASHRGRSNRRRL